ncbi:hypothetical protein CVT25_000912 [Psilocybe cyanescens]|uniref:F-box domain-containing protein n=1 Tax=Psilocybe cyanescens TaxID=93625 RepID=A0A409WZF6_PSICY|nr:hypothetical protein CVT25_000912 [Psilocybe cyanescens]
MQYIPSVKASTHCFIQRLIRGGNNLIEPPVSLPSHTIQSLPIEILLHIFSFLELKAYIISNGVCKGWRCLLPFADIHPSRRRLFALFQSMINTPLFLNSRPWTLANLQPFDRQAYIDALLAQYSAVPEEFRIWILEWPARLAIACMWPGLPFNDCYRGNSMRRYGVNWLGYRNNSPELLAVICNHKTPDVKFIPGLLIWRAFTTTEWLIFDQEDIALFGRVYITDFMKLESSVVIPHDRQPNIKEELNPEAISFCSNEDDDCQEECVYPGVKVSTDVIHKA